jgi:exonuclease III
MTSMTQSKIHTTSTAVLDKKNPRELQESINEQINKNSDRINIIIHNVQGLSNKPKFQTWLTYCYEENTHIIAMSETKLKQDNEYALTNPLYRIFMSNFKPTEVRTREASMGTALAIRMDLCPHIHNIEREPGTAIMVDLFLLQKNKKRIISIYLPSNNKELNIKAQNKIIRWLTEAHTRNWQAFVMGDFNTNQNRKGNSPLLSYMI